MFKVTKITHQDYDVLSVPREHDKPLIHAADFVVVACHLSGSGENFPLRSGVKYVFMKTRSYYGKGSVIKAADALSYGYVNPSLFNSGRRRGMRYFTRSQIINNLTNGW